MADSFQYDVFISHSSKEKGIVLDLAQPLKKDRLRVWLRHYPPVNAIRVRLR